MSFDISRFTFDHRKNFHGVVMEQGRVQLDSDWNEWLAELLRRIQAGTLDIFGHASYPPTTPSAFLITATSSPNGVTIGDGRMYVDGLLAENHGSASMESWDPSLAELSNAPQPPNPASPNPNPISYLSQPYYPNPQPLPTDNNSYIFYLDVWTRAVDYLEDPRLVDKAVGVDTTGRLQTVWQVKYMPNNTAHPYTCATPDSQIFPASIPGRLTTGVISNTPAGPCCLTDSTGYTGVENQCYRVEIQQAGVGSDPATGTGALFKWSRDNASVQTLVLAITSTTNLLSQPASALTVTSLGRDEVLGFKAGDWIEILDNWTELSGQAGTLYQIDSVSVSPPTITTTQPVVTTNFSLNAHGQTAHARHTRIRRWDQSGNVYDNANNPWGNVNDFQGAIPVPANTTLVLENGITVQFQLPPGATQFNVGDFWTFAARTADGSVEELKAAPSLGIHHHLTKLALVTLSPLSSTDCRNPWSCDNEGGCGCAVTVGEGGQYTSIQAAVNAVIATGGEVQILPGRYYEYVTIANGHDIVIRGCGAETRLASPSMNPNPNTAAAPAAEQPASGLQAIVTIIGSTNVELQSFAVEAANEVGVLVDSGPFQTGQTTPQPLIDPYSYLGDPRAFSSHVTVSDLAITASTMPGFVAIQALNLSFTKNRVAMQDVSSLWPAVWVSGSAIHVDHNWIGLQDTANAAEWMPATVINDVPAGFSATQATPPAANGGIQIAGYSQDVFVVDNEIEGGARNGISLGSFTIDAEELTIEAIFGLLATLPASTTTFDLTLPENATLDGQQRGRVVSGGALDNVQISRNRIRNVGLCGIGPVGFFNLGTTFELVTVVNLVISENVITGSLRDSIAPITQETLVYGYGAICLVDAQNVVIRDNIITDFGDTPGAAVCGVFLLCGEQIEIRGNQIQETRDWSASSNPAAATVNPQVGIFVSLATPPSLNPAQGSSFVQGANFLEPAYQPGLPAVRIDNNVVRVALGLALEVVGFGPFTITGNHFATGGTVSGPTPSTQSSAVTTVLVLNLGLPIEAAPATRFFDYYNGAVSALTFADAALGASSSGAVLFANNRCQLEARASGVQGFASVAVMCLDSLQFSGNHCWVDGVGETAIFGGTETSSTPVLSDAVLLAFTTQVIGNRFQEAVNSTRVSALTVGLANITTNNLATYCIVPEGLPSLLTPTPNIVLNSKLCENNETTAANEVIKESVSANIEAADNRAQQRAANRGPVQQARLAQAERTETYTTKQYGASSAQAKNAAAAVTSAKAFVLRVAVQNRQLTVKVPTAPAKGWTLYGHVYTAQLQPASAYTVFIVDPQNAYQSAIGFAYTATDGSYQLNYTPASGTPLPTELYLEIANNKAEPVYLGSAALQMGTGVATPMDITLPWGEPVIGDPPAALRAIGLPPAGNPTTGTSTSGTPTKR